MKSEAGEKIMALIYCVASCGAIFFVVIALYKGRANFIVEDNPIPQSFNQVQVKTFRLKEKFITQKEVELVEIGDKILFGKVVVEWTTKNAPEENIAVLIIPYQEIQPGTKIEISSVEFFPNRMMPAYFYIVNKIHK